MAATVEIAIWLALKEHVKTLDLDLPFNWPLETFTPPVTGSRQVPYIEVRSLPNNNVRPFVGSDDPQTRQGILQLTLCWPVANVGPGKTNPDVLIQIAGEIAEHFGTDQRLLYENVSLRIARAPDVAQPFRDDAYWRVPVSVYWRSHALPPVPEST